MQESIFKENQVNALLHQVQCNITVMGKRRTICGLFTPFLRDCTEDCDPVQASVQGSIPSWLSGFYLVNGPGGQKFADHEYGHLFDGPAYLRKFTIKNGSVTFEAKFLQSQTYRKNQKHGKIVVNEFGTRGYPDPCKTIFQRLSSYFFLADLFNDNDQVTLLKLSGKYYSVGETPLLTEIELDSLKTLGSIDIRRYVSVSTLASHTHKDDGGNVYAVGSSFGYYNIIRIPNCSQSFQKASLVSRIPFRHTLYPSYYHSFGLTENFFVFIEQPLVLSIPSLLWNHFTGQVTSSILKWKPEYKTQIHLINRKDGSAWPVTYFTEPFAFFHTINAYEDDGHVVVDVCCYDNADILKSLYTEAMREAASSRNEARNQAKSVQSQAKRFVLPLYPSKYKKETANLNKLSYSQSKATWHEKESIYIESEGLTPCATLMAEMPQINYSRNGRKYRYFYALCRRKGDLLLQLMKCDVQRKEIKVWCQNDFYPSEPIFIAKPDSKDEDDGIILSYVLSEIQENHGFLLVLDGKSFKEIARASFHSSSRLLPQFHGLFSPI